MVGKYDGNDQHRISNLYDCTSIKNARVYMQISWTNGRLYEGRDATVCANEIFNFFPIALHRRYRASLSFFPGNIILRFRQAPDTFVRQFRVSSNQCFHRAWQQKKKKRESAFKKMVVIRMTIFPLFYSCALCIVASAGFINCRINILIEKKPEMSSKFIIYIKICY